MPWLVAAAVFAVAPQGCKPRAEVATTSASDAAVENVSTAPDGGRVARADAGARPDVETLTWDASGKRAAYFRGDELFLVDTDRFAVVQKLRVAGFEFRLLALLADGGAVVVGTEATDGGSAGARVSSYQRSRFQTDRG